LSEEKKNKRSDLCCEGASFSKESGEIRLGDKDLVVFDGGALRAVIKAHRELLSSGADPIWYEAGKSIGKEFEKDIVDLKKKMPLDKVASFIAEMLTSKGWGSIDVVAVNSIEKEAILHIKSCPLIRGINSDKPVCYFISGSFEGIFEKIFETEVTCREIKCQAKGDPYCEFHVVRKA